MKFYVVPQTHLLKMLAVAISVPCRVSRFNFVWDTNSNSFVSAFRDCEQEQHLIIADWNPLVITSDHKDFKSMYAVYSIISKEVILYF